MVVGEFYDSDYCGNQTFHNTIVLIDEYISSRFTFQLTGTGRLGSVS